jgi:DNA polymerase-3 subunit gamma/tau
VATDPIKVVEAEAPVASEPELPEADEQEPVEAEAEEPELPVVDEPDAEPAFEAEAEAPKSRNSHMVDESARYGESLLREMLGAKPIDDKGKK